MHSKRRYKICICSVILGELESFRNHKGFSIMFPKHIDAIQRITKVRIFHHTFILDMRRKLHVNGTIIMKFLAVLKL